MGDLISREEFIKHKDILKKIFNVFKKEYSIYAINKRGIVNNKDIDNIMLKVKNKFKLTDEEDIVVEGFFDTVMGLIMSIGDFDSVENLLHNLNII